MGEALASCGGYTYDEVKGTVPAVNNGTHLQLHGMRILESRIYWLLSCVRWKEGMRIIYAPAYYELSEPPALYCTYSFSSRESKWAYWNIRQ